MNLGIVTSYIVAGVILLGIVAMNVNVQNSSAELTLTQMQRQYVINITDMLNDDLPNMGYDVNDVTRDSEENIKILECAKVNEISFYRNLCETDVECNNSDRPRELVEWRLLNEEISNSNPNHRTLRRTVTTNPGSEDPVVDINNINVGVTEFNIQYYNKVGSTEPLTTGVGCGTNLGTIKQLKVTLEVQSAERIYQRAQGSGRFINSIWEKRFTPPNLQIKD